MEAVEAVEVLCPVRSVREHPLAMQSEFKL